MTSPDRAALADSTDEEALALVMNVLQQIADEAYGASRGDYDEGEIIASINNLARDAVDALAKRTMGHSGREKAQ